MPDEGGGDVHLLERELEREMLMRLHQENLQRKQELEWMQRAQATSSSWSAVTPDSGGIPVPPPPRSRSPSRKSQIRRGPNSHQMELDCLMALLQKQQRCRISQHGLFLLPMTGARIGVLARNLDVPGPFRQGHDPSQAQVPDTSCGGCIHNSSTSRFSVGSCEGRSGWGAELWTRGSSSRRKGYPRTREIWNLLMMVKSNFLVTHHYIRNNANVTRFNAAIIMDNQ